MGRDTFATATDLQELTYYSDKQCVFVLAIDYEVVIQRVREKYSGDIPLSKCCSVFDKIIQLSFRMPVESYDLYGLVEKHLGGVIGQKYHKALIRFMECAIGKNPRPFKRMLNSYLLIRSVYENSGGMKTEAARRLCFTASVSGPARRRPIRCCYKMTSGRTAGVPPFTETVFSRTI